jgi:hypothetical protein
MPELKTTAPGTNLSKPDSTDGQPSKDDPASSDGQPTDAPQTDVAARQADLDWGLFGAQPGGEQMDLFDQPAEQDPGTSGVDVAKFSF